MARLRSKKPGNETVKNKKLIGVVAGVGLCSGLLGGGVVIGVNNYCQNHVATRVRKSSNQAGGTNVNENKADLNNHATQSFQNLQTAIELMLNQQKHGLYYN